MKSSYPAYRAGGVPWLTDVPQHWGVKRIKEVSYLKGRVGWKGLTSDEFLESGFACLVTGTDFRAKHIDWSECYWVDQERYEDDPFIQLMEGDLLITKDGTIGKLAIVTELENPACLNSGIFLVRPITSFKTAYLYWVLSSSAFSHFCDLASYGSTIQHLYQNVFENFAFPIPPEAEQEAIVAFLDREIAKIDALVEEQRRLIELLNEKRQAVITKAVTNGVQPDAVMKASGVSWLGNVPEHWDLRTVGAVCSYLSYGFTNPMPTAEEGPYMLTANDIRDGYIDFDKARMTTSDAFQGLTAKSRPAVGDVLVTKDGTLGRVALYDGPVACINQSVALLRPKPTMEPAFLALCLQGGVYQDRMVYEAGGTTIKHIYISRLAKMPLASPPLQEQIEICRHIDVVAQQFDQLASEARRAVDVLMERRTALITAAVTGAIDVRPVAEVRPVLSRARLRTIVAAEIIDQLSHKKAFGRVKLQKLLYLAETDVGIADLEGEYLREAAGPLDRGMMADAEAGLRQHSHVEVAQPEGPGGQVVYQLRGERGAYHSELVGAVGERAAGLAKLVRKLGDLDTKSVEAVTTLYAIWNDTLIDQNEPTDATIVSGVLEDWHPEKALKFKADELHTWLGWMRRHELVPRGNGPRTTMGRLFA